MDKQKEVELARAEALRQAATETLDQRERELLEDEATEAEGKSLLGVGHLRVDPRLDR